VLGRISNALLAAGGEDGCLKWAQVGGHDGFVRRKGSCRHLDAVMVPETARTAMFARVMEIGLLMRCVCFYPSPILLEPSGDGLVDATWCHVSFRKLKASLTVLSSFSLSCSGSLFRAVPCVTITARTAPTVTEASRQRLAEE
jgi:hypothetical protein